MSSPAVQRCINPSCGASYPIGEVLVACRACGALLDVAYSWAGGPLDWRFAERRACHGGGLDASGVWRFRELMPFYGRDEAIVSIGEGRTILQRADLLAGELGFSRDGAGAGRLYLQYEGLNPSGSFKDNGMTAAFTHARMVGAGVVACASTGNTSASMAVYARQAGMKAVIFIGSGKIAYGKLSQALDYGALTLQVAGDFDACLARVRHIAERIPRAGVYLMNSVNPFRLEGQKAVMFRVLESLCWQPPDWVIVPGGNLGNCSAFGKAFMELRALGLLKKVPRLAVINAAGASTLDRVYNRLGVRWNGGAYFTDGGAAEVDEEYARMDAANERASTIATAIEINRPVNLPKALRALEVMNGATAAAGWNDGQPGVVRSVDDDTIRHFKAMVGRFGFGCEPASAASVAGAALLKKEGIIRPTDSVVCILTGHQLKDPDVTVAYHTGLDAKAAKQPLPTARPPGHWANPPVAVADDLGAILRAMGVPTEGLDLSEPAGATTSRRDS
ncbi:MAG: threonine synthase [Phycisphaeraceae bacterium]|nr:threonine synthase [Phycisphaeraceae bacterium]